MSATILVIAMALDAVFGEPRWLWDRVTHPAILMGRAIGWADARFNRAGLRVGKGMLLVAALFVGSLLTALIISTLPLAGLWEVLIVAVLLAQRSLATHVGDVARALAGSLGEARRAVARIVGRDTSEMDEPAVARAAIESAAENLSDGVIAPAIFYLVFGLPGILFYKAVNTADSMIGYKTPEYAGFGWAAARLDDVLNWVPARLTALGLSVLSGTIGMWPDITRDARRHRSPNAGWPEAAMARALDVALAGPRSYAGKRNDFPFVNPGGRHDAGPHDIRQSVTWLWRLWAGLLVLTLASSLLA